MMDPGLQSAGVTTLKGLGHVADLWLDPQNPLRKETIQALQVSTGFSRRQIEMALANAFEELTADKIASYIESFYLLERSNVGTVLHLLPSNVFTAWLPGAVITLLMGHPCLLKPSTREPVFARAWKRSLEAVDPGLAERVEIVSWDDQLLQRAKAVVAYGSDETLHLLQNRLPKGVCFIGYGHKLSVAILFKEALESGFTEELLERVRLDVEPFRLQGCLSPQVLYVEGAQFTRWPTLEAQVDVTPKLKSFERWEDVFQELVKFQPYLSSVGYAGSPKRIDAVREALKVLGVTRICPLGEMQRPPLAWRNGGIFLPDLLNSTLEGGSHEH